MSRFFINYPDLLNHDLIGNKKEEKSLWGELATEIVNEAKEEPISLESIAKRIAYYRQKSQDNDVLLMNNLDYRPDRPAEGRPASGIGLRSQNECAGNRRPQGR